MKAPFPWFGGKRRVADVVWRAFGADVPNYVEPFAGSLAVLLGRPGGAGKIETVNDRDRYLANFWRSVAADPLEVARHADWPVNEADLHARHKWLVNQSEFRERMHADPTFYDVKIAGWWVWGLCQWIGGGWCVEPNNHKHPKLDGIGKGVHARNRGTERHTEANRPELAGAGKGVHSQSGSPKRQLPDLAVTCDGASTGRGVHSSSAHAKRPNLAGLDKGVLSRSDHHQAPHLSSENGVHRSGALRGRPRPNLNSGQGVHAAQAYSSGRRPAISSAGQGVHLPSLGNDRGLNGVAAIPCADWFLELQARLRRVRVACGDWRRVLGPSVLGKGRNVGGRRPCAVFLDPPYSFEFRDPYLYSEDDGKISALVREWAIEHGDDPDLRIALCGYEGEHEMPASWQVYAWKAARGYASEDNENRTKERIWFSPHCLPLLCSASRQVCMFEHEEPA